jgi:hypothetical protein
MRVSIFNRLAILAIALIATRAAFARSAPFIDVLSFGNDASEQQHHLVSTNSEVTLGALDQPARRLLPSTSDGWQGGRIAFVMNVDPARQTYLTVRFWGDEVNTNYLILFCDGKQVGYRHLGDVDVLGVPDDEPRYNGRFYYVTTPLPLAMTQGKSLLSMEIRATGPIWGYGATFNQYQKPMTLPSRCIYRVYTHTDGCFVPPADEPQGQAPAATPRVSPGPEVIGELKRQVNGTIDELLRSTKSLNQMQMELLARAYWVRWTNAYQQPRVVQQVINGVDARYRAWKINPELVWNDPATWNPGWFALGPAGNAVRLLAQPVVSSNALAMLVDGKPRREAWSALFRASVEYERHNRRWLSNQAMFSDTNLYLSNRALEAIDPLNALPEGTAIQYLYQSAGLMPWLGPETEAGPTRPFGDHFYQVTDKGLTRERGYVGGYGEVGTAGVMEMYDATRPPGAEGDARLKTQLAKMIRARGVFRYPMLDDDNHSAMRLETGIGWRDSDFPGSVTYVQRSGGENSSLREAAATLDPNAVGYAQQMLADNQFFKSVADQMKGNRLRDTFGLLGIPDEYELIAAQPPSAHRLPMSWDQPDFVFADEQDGVVAIKHGREILYVSLYWRAGFGINHLARTHYLTPGYQQVAVVHEDVKFDASGMIYTRPDWINFGFGDGGVHIGYPSDLHQALAGETLPIAKIPWGVRFEPGQESYSGGFGDFYSLRYGRYRIGMNTTKDRTFLLDAPTGQNHALDLDSGRVVSLNGTLKIAPESTVVLYLGQD